MRSINFLLTWPNDVRERRYNFFTPFTILAPQDDPVSQSSLTSAMMYRKARTTNVPNFVPFCQSIYEIMCCRSSLISLKAWPTELQASVSVNDWRKSPHRVAGPSDPQNSRNSTNKCSLAKPITLLRQELCEVSTVKSLCYGKSEPKFTKNP